MNNDIQLHEPPPRPAPDDFSMWYRCPKCGFTSEIDGFDVMGADDGCLFCPDCHHHGRMRHLSVATAKKASAAIE